MIPQFFTICFFIINKEGIDLFLVLDGLLGTQAPTFASSSIPQLQAASTPSPHVPNVSGKRGVPCIFFQKGTVKKATSEHFCMHRILQVQ